MKTPVQVCLLVLAMFVETCAQEASPCEQKEQKIAAVVMAPVVGTCQLRDDENAKPQPIKSGTAVRAGQALQCNRGSHLKIQFCNSRLEKNVAHALKWYVIPNVPSLHAPSPALLPALRYYWYYDGCPGGKCVNYHVYFYQDVVSVKEIELWRLYQKKEAKALGAAMSDDFYAIYPDGQRVSKRRFLQDMVKINLKKFLWSDVNVDASSTKEKKLSYVVMAHLSKKGQKSSILIEVTSKWILRDGRWYIVSHQQKSILDW